MDIRPALMNTDYGAGSTRPKNFTLYLLVVVLVVVSFSCKKLANQPEPTATQLPTVSFTPSPSASSLPTGTPTQTPQPTSTATVTLTSTPHYAATSDARSTQFAATALVDIRKDLKNYRLTTESGNLVWINTIPVTLTVDTYRGSEYTMIDPTLVVSDFVFQTDVAWESSGGLAGCGYMFRADRSMSLGRYYEFYAIRLSGLPLWFAAYWEESIVRKVLSPQFATSAAIRQKYGSTNSFGVLAQGDQITFYANGKRLGTNRNDQLSKGRFALQALQESGETTCIFTNTWVWALK